MKALLWKDVMVNRLVLLVGVLLLIGPYCVTAFFFIGSDLWSTLSPRAAWGAMLEASSYFSILFSQGTIVVLGANIIACERVDRSAEFLAYLPPSRTRIILSKIILLLCTMAVIWGLNLGVMAIADLIQTGDVSFVGNDRHVIIKAATTGLTMCGVGWLMSSFMSSPAPAVVVAVPSPLIVVGILAATMYGFDWPQQREFGKMYDYGCVALSELCFLAGTTYYIRRVEP